MARYGNILALFDANQQIKNDVEDVLSDNQTNYMEFNELYFVETNSKKNTGDVIRGLQDLDIVFIFYHNNISDGSLIKSKGIKDDTIDEINTILFK